MAADKDAGSVGRIIASMLHSLHVVPVQHMRLMKCQDLHAALSRAAEGTQCTVRVRPLRPPPPRPKGCIRMEGTSEAAPEDGGCRRLPKRFEAVTVGCKCR